MLKHKTFRAVLFSLAAASFPAAAWAQNAAAPNAPATKPAEKPSPNITPKVEPLPRPVAQIKRALVFSIDGCRPDLLLRANTPNIHKLMEGGCFTMWARTTPNSITLPSHMSMLTGVNPRRHGVEWNRDFDTIQPLYPNAPTLFEAAKRHGYTTAVASGKVKFDMFDRPGVLDWKSIPDKKTLDDGTVLKSALEILREHKPEVMLVHFPTVDSWGHTKGWSSPEQMKALADADMCVGQVLATLDELGLRDSTLIVLSADHGGQGRGHGPEDARSRHIPWIASGPGLRKGYDLTINPKLQVNTEDTFATVCWALGIRPTLADLDGVPVKEILEPKKEQELLQSSATAKKPLTW